MRNLLLNNANRMLALAILGIVVGSSSLGVAAPPASEQRLLAEKLSQTASGAWQDQQLANVLEKLAEVYGLPVWLDRRVDPQCSVEAAVRNKPLMEIIESVAASCGARAVVFRSLIYIGPEQTTLELATLAELAEQSLSALPSRERRLWRRKTVLAWSQPAEPGDLLRKIAGGANARLENPQLLPHDLWRRKTLAPLSAIDQATLLLAGFDLTGRITDEGLFRVESIKRPVLSTHTYENSTLSAHRMTELLDSVQGISWTREGRQWRVTGRVEQHDALKAKLTGKSTANGAKQRGKSPRGQRAFTLTIKNQPLGPVVDQLAKQIGITVKWGAKAESQKSSLVSCQVSEATLEELWNALLLPIGLTAEPAGEGFRIVESHVAEDN